NVTGVQTCALPIWIPLRDRTRPQGGVQRTPRRDLRGARGDVGGDTDPRRRRGLAPRDGLGARARGMMVDRPLPVVPPRRCSVPWNRPVVRIGRRTLRSDGQSVYQGMALPHGVVRFEDR